MAEAIIVGVMGGGDCDQDTWQSAFRLGRLIAENGWILLNGGRACGVMEASARGARQAGGLTVGILPDADRSNAAKDILIPVCTGMGSARNAINVLSSDIVVACRGGPGTVSEIALALKSGKTVICLDFNTGKLFRPYQDSGRLFHVSRPREAVALIKRRLAESGG